MSDESTPSLSTISDRATGGVVESHPPTGSVMEGMLSETAITVNGLPGSVSLAQITKMFGDFGVIKNITFSPYQMMGHSLMNAIVTVALKEGDQNTKPPPQRAGTMPPAPSMEPVHSERSSNSGFSFQENEVKDRSVDKEEIKTMRRGGMGGGGGGGRGGMMALSLKQHRSVTEYLVDRNASQVALRVGYSPRTAPQRGHGR